MLKSLTIKNLALIEEAHVDFGPAFNVITGESGAGKSSLLSALRFALGQRADSSYVRAGAEKASILAVFEKETLHDLLTGFGIDSEDDRIIIKRELSSAGTSKAFINNQPVLLSTLEKITRELIQFATQQAQSALVDPEMQRKMLDSYAGVDLLPFQDYLQELKEKKAEREQVQIKANKKEILLEKLYTVRKLLQERDLLVQEDEIFAAYQTAESRKEQYDLLERLQSDLFTPEKNLLGKLYRYSTQLSSFAQVSDLLKSIHAECSDLSFTLAKLLSEPGPSSNELANQLKTIDRLKAVWHENIVQETDLEIALLENIEVVEEAINCEIEDLEQKVKTLADSFSALRLKAARSLQTKVSSQLEKLHMKAAQFHIELNEERLSMTGQERVEFMLQANAGERKTPLKGFASGGELSRLLLAIKEVLADNRPVLVFDEIDAAIGGMTAVAVADKLKNLAVHHQVICITHLPQMAEGASHHLMIEKYTEKGRTFTKVKALSLREQKDELKRMRGIDEEHENRSLADKIVS